MPGAWYSVWVKASTQITFLDELFGGISGSGENVSWGAVTILELGLESQVCLLGNPQTTKCRLTGLGPC